MSPECSLLLKDVTPRKQEGCFFSFSREARLWPFPLGQPVGLQQSGLTPVGLSMTPEWGKEGCCHGGLCEANSSRVKWEIFIPRVRQRAGGCGGQGSRAGRTQQGRGGEWHSSATSWFSVWVWSPWPTQKLHRNTTRSPMTTTPCESEASLSRESSSSWASSSC
ncbi:PREDICTED: phospholemman isoform X2 [Condylura cristata]|uniref:phospholemman isoform X2 n=1 Tax=Condylura cristata TaxID=143302 RepID=UPI0006432EDF|nr:PREDICTED: phospholemman isoform X2 [Condylura cristata]